MHARVSAQFALRSLLVGCTALCVTLGVWRFELLAEWQPVVRILFSVVLASLFIGGLVGFTSSGEHGFVMTVVSWLSMAILLFVVALSVLSGTS